MTSPSSCTHFDLEVIRSSLAETELKCALFRDVERHQGQVKLQYKNNGPIMNLMNHSDHLFNKTSDHLREKSDRSDSTNEIDNSIHKRHGLLNGDNGNTTNTKTDRPKPFVPPKQVLMYLVR